MDKSARAVLITVVGLWAIGIAILLVQKRDVLAIPLPLWAIPGATYTVLTGSIPGLPRRDRQPAAGPENTEGGS